MPQLDHHTPAYPFVPGERIRVTAMRYDGTPYRWWDATVEAVTPDCVVTFSPAGGTVYQPDGNWLARVSVRTYYWSDRMYNLGEFLAPERERSGLYVHIASTPTFSPGEIRYHDYELDVLKYVGQPAKVVDEEEFQQAGERYGYSPEFQATCRKAVDEALHLVEAWVWPLAKDV